MTKSNRAERDLLAEKSRFTELNLHSCVDVAFAEKTNKTGQREHQCGRVLLGEFKGDLGGERATWNVWLEPECGKSFSPGRSFELFFFSFPIAEQHGLHVCLKIDSQTAASWSQTTYFCKTCNEFHFTHNQIQLKMAYRTSHTSSLSSLSSLRGLPSHSL